MKVMGTGSRSMVTAPDRIAVYQNLDSKILQLQDEDPHLVLISGMAEGWDEAIAKIGMRREIPYIVCLPNDGYGRYYWAQHSLLGVNRIDMFNELILHATEVIIVCNSLYEDGIHSNFVRNQFMVDLCDAALVYNPSSSGTRDAVGRLRAAHKPYFCAPFDLQERLAL
jgi:uncharacterized phage-like protein YoqJ